MPTFPPLYMILTFACLHLPFTSLHTFSPSTTTIHYSPLPSRIYTLCTPLLPLLSSFTGLLRLTYGYYAHLCRCRTNTAAWATCLLHPCLCYCVPSAILPPAAGMYTVIHNGARTHTLPCLAGGCYRHLAPAAAWHAHMARTHLFYHHMYTYTTTLPFFFTPLPSCLLHTPRTPLPPPALPRAHARSSHTPHATATACLYFILLFYFCHHTYILLRSHHCLTLLHILYAYHTRTHMPYMLLILRFHYLLYSTTTYILYHTFTFTGLPP